MSRTLRQTATLLALACVVLSTAATVPAKKKKPNTPAPSHTTKPRAAHATKALGKATAKSARTTHAAKSTAGYEKYVPVPAARPVIPQHEAAAADPETAVPTPDIAAEQQTSSYSTASPEAASALSVQQRLQHGPSALHFADALHGFFASLAVQTIPATSTVRALQFGDSHTAADMFTGEMRSQLQARFGDGSVGFTYAGHPFAGYRILGSGRGQTGGWTTLGTHFTQLGDAMLGLGGVAIETDSPGASASLSVNCKTLDVHFLRRAGGGSFNINLNSQPLETVYTDITTPQPGDNAIATTPAVSAAATAGSVTLTCAPGHSDFTFTARGDGPVRLLGTVALQPGITYEAAGINGAEAPLILRWNRPLFDSYLAARAPQLIVLAYGTNEAAARWTHDEYAATFATLIDHLHTTAPEASILVLGPGDRALGTTHTTVTGHGRHTHRVSTRSFVAYAGTERILSAQREVCATHGCAFWDWSARMGGLGSMQRWVAAGYAQPDHTHLTGTGYRALADALFADLMGSYESFAKHSTMKN